jgi:hypothetical protein
MAGRNVTTNTDHSKIIRHYFPFKEKFLVPLSELAWGRAQFRK